jgi:peptide/nickel transport system permease protein
MRQGLPVRWIVRKTIATLALLWGVASLVFVLVELSPGSVVDKFVGPDVSPEVRELTIRKLGLDRPAYVRYVAMMATLARGDLGTSLVQERPVGAILLDALPNTLLLSGVTLLVLYPVGIGLGVLQAVRQGKAADTAASVGGLALYSVPEFWLALMLQVVAAKVGLPLSGMHDAVTYDDLSDAGKVLDTLEHLLLPGVAMGLASAAGVARYMRSSMLEVIRQDYVRTARAKGLPERVVIGRHALRNALLPILTLVGLSLPALVGGSVLVETVFAWPGMGRLIVDAIQQQDTPVIVACFLLFSTMVAAGNLLADALYAVADPRIRVQA